MRLRTAAKNATKLEREGIGYARVWALMLRSGVAAVERREGAAALLRDTIAEAEAQAMDCLAAIAMHRLGRMVGGTEGAHYCSK